MKSSIKNIVLISSIIVMFTACKEDEGEDGELSLKFKTEAGYTSSDATVETGTKVKIGIEAETEKAKDPIIKFNISESVNGGKDSTVHSEGLEDQDFEYDYEFTLADSVQGNTHMYTFTVTNRDGINAQKSIVITVK